MALVNKSEERAFVRELLRLYQSLPALWNTSCKDYGDRVKKAQSYDILLAKYCQRYPSATKEDIKKRINVLRTNYRKVKKKNTDQETKEAQCWYYKDLSFIEDKDPDQRTPIISLENIKYAEIPEQRLPAVSEKSAGPSSVSRDSDSDEYMRIAWVWANELSKASPDQQMFAKKAINDILFEAQMGTLDRHSVTISDSPQIMNYYSSKEHE